MFDEFIGCGELILIGCGKVFDDFTEMLIADTCCSFNCFLATSIFYVDLI